MQEISPQIKQGWPKATVAVNQGWPKATIAVRLPKMAHAYPRAGAKWEVPPKPLKAHACPEAEADHAFLRAGADHACPRAKAE